MRPTIKPDTPIESSSPAPCLCRFLARLLNGIGFAKIAVLGASEAQGSNSWRLTELTG